MVANEKETANVHKPESFINPEQDKKDAGTVGDDGNVTKAGNSALQKAISAALKNVDGTTDSVTIQLTEGDYAGNVMISDKLVSHGVTLKSGFVLNIISEDTSRTANAKGTLTVLPDAVSVAKLAGDILIDSINVMLAGLTVGDGNTISVSGANLWYTGTANDDAVKISLRNGARADVVTGEGNDAVDISAAVSVASDPHPAAGIGKVKVSTGDGNDTVSVSEAGLSYAAGDNERINMEIAGGSGNDRFNVDVLSGDIFAKITISGAEGGGDRIHLTGELLKAEDSGKITMTDGVFKIKNKNFGDSGLLTIEASGIENYTEDLKNKSKVEIGITDLTVIDATGKKYSYTASQPFTDYVLAARTEDIESLKLNAQSGMTFLGKLVIDEDSTGEDVLKIRNLDAWDFTSRVSRSQLRIASSMLTTMCPS